MKDSRHNAASWIAAHACDRGAKLAVRDDVCELTYAELWLRINRCAGAFAEAGVGPGDRVALVLGNRAAYLEVLFAAAQLGAMAVPINARLTAWEIRQAFDDCTPRVLVYDGEHAEVALGACDGAAEPPRDAPAVRR